MTWIPDSHSLLHRFTRFRTAITRPFPESLHWNNWYDLCRHCKRQTLNDLHQGVITYSTNTDTSTVVHNMVAPPSEPLSESSESSASPSSLRILLETDAPFMVPANLYDDLPAIRGKKLPVCHTAMIPWTAKFVADITNKARLRSVLPTPTPASADTEAGPEPTTEPEPAEVAQTDAWDADLVMRVARNNARSVYGV